MYIYIYIYINFKSIKNVLDAKMVLEIYLFTKNICFFYRNFVSITIS